MTFRKGKDVPSDTEKEPSRQDEDTAGRILPEVSSEEASGTPLSVDFEALCAENGDVVGWLYSEGTPISYPVAQANDNEKYLRHLLDGKYNIAGTLFADYRQKPPFQEGNTFIYGHNLHDHEMFGTLLNYRKESYYKEHPVMWLLTPEGDYLLRVVGWMETDAYSDIYDLTATREELASLIEEARARMSYRTDVALTGEEPLITLSTCAYDYDDARFLVFLTAEKADGAE